MSLCNGAASVVCPSVNFCANRFFSHANGRIATKLAHDGLQVSVHPGCAQGQRSRDTCTFLDYWNELLRHWRSGLIITATRAGTEGCYEMLLFDRDDMIFKRLFRAVFGEIRWHFNTMLSRTVCRIYMDSLSRSYDVADDVRSSQVPVSWRNVHRMVPRRACIRGVLKVHVEVKGLKIRPSVLCLTCSTLDDFKRPCVRRIIGAGRAENVWRRGSRFGQYENS